MYLGTVGAITRVPRTSSVSVYDAHANYFPPFARFSNS